MEKRFKDAIEKIIKNKSLLKKKETQEMLTKIVKAFEDGKLKIAKPTKKGWEIKEWLIDALFVIIQAKKHGLQISGMRDDEEFKKIGVRQLQGSLVRRTACVEVGAILMPSFINMGASVGSGTTIDTWATVGSGAQIGANCHISGGLGIGGVLEPRQKSPVIIEDGCFIGSRAIIVEGVRIGEDSVIGSGTIITSSIKIFDTRSGTPIESPSGIIPAGVVAIAASYQAKTGLFRPCVEIIKNVDRKSEGKTKLSKELR